MKLPERHRFLRLPAFHKFARPKTMLAPIAWRRPGLRGPCFDFQTSASLWRSMTSGLVKLCKFRACSFLDPDQFVEFGMQREIVPAVSPLNEHRHHEDGECRERVPLERGRADFRCASISEINGVPGNYASRFALEATCRR